MPTRPNPKTRSNRMPDCSYSLTYRISRPFTRFLRPHIPTHFAVDGCNHSAPASHLTPLSRALKYRLLLSPSPAHTHNKSIPPTSFSSNIIRLLLFLYTPCSSRTVGSMHRLYHLVTPHHIILHYITLHYTTLSTIGYLIIIIETSTAADTSTP